MIKHTPNDNKKMFRLLWTLVIVAIVAAEDATCGDIKALYQSESCCGAGDTTLTNLETVTVSETTAVYSAFLSELRTAPLTSSPVAEGTYVVSPTSIQGALYQGLPSELYIFGAKKGKSFMAIFDPVTNGTVFTTLQEVSDPNATAGSFEALAPHRKPEPFKSKVDNSTLYTFGLKVISLQATGDGGVIQNSFELYDVVLGSGASKPSRTSSRGFRWE